MVSEQSTTVLPNTDVKIELKKVNDRISYNKFIDSDTSEQSTSVQSDDESVSSHTSEQSTSVQSEDESAGSHTSEVCYSEYHSGSTDSIFKIPISHILTRGRSMVLPKSNLNKHEPGSIATIIAENPILILNVISSQNSKNRQKHQLENGDQVRICTRPVKDSVYGDNRIRIHFMEKVWLTCYSSNCRCGNCGNFCEILPDPPAKCECGTDPYDEGEQQCSIM